MNKTLNPEVSGLIQGNAIFLEVLVKVCACAEDARHIYILCFLLLGNALNLLNILFVNVRKVKVVAAQPTCNLLSALCVLDEAEILIAVDRRKAEKDRHGSFLFYHVNHFLVG